MYKADYNIKQTLILSNDAFYNLYYGEELLDDNNIEEIENILGLFPNGFDIIDWKIIGENKIQTVFVPYIIDDEDFDEYMDLTQYIRLQIKWIDTSHIKLWWLNLQAGEKILKGEFEVLVNQFKHKYFQVGKNGSIFFLKDFKKKV